MDVSNCAQNRTRNSISSANIPPETSTLENWEYIPADTVVRYFMNSVLVASVSTVAVLITSALAGTVFAKYSFPFKVLFMIILNNMVPFSAMIPFYSGVKSWFVDSYTGILLPLVIWDLEFSCASA